MPPFRLPIHTELGKKAHVLLANGTHTPEEPDENARSRQELRSSGVNVYDRIITASGVLAHNKFVVFTEGDKATMAWTGSTNWTKSGLCTQVWESARFPANVAFV